MGRNRHPRPAQADKGAAAPFAMAHGPFFTLAGMWAIVAIAAMPAIHAGLLTPPLPGWHAHEMLFGFGGAALAGYTLSAAPGWSGRPPVSGQPVVFLVCLWLLARLAALGLAPLSAAPAFLAVLALLLGREAVFARSWKGAGQAGFAAALALAEGAMVHGMIDGTVPALGFALILSGLGGRIVAAFTANRVPALRGPGPVQSALSVAGPAAVLAALILSLSDQPAVAGGALLAAGIIEAARAASWTGRGAESDALLAMLHLAYLWLPAGLLLLGAARLGLLDADATDLLHMLTAGAMAGLVYAVASRSFAHRRDGRLVAALPEVAGFALLSLAALLRVWLPGADMAVLIPWCGAWALFVTRAAPMMLRPPQRPVFSGRRR